MSSGKNATKKLVSHYREISLLNKVNAVLDWDLNVNLPPKATSARASQKAYITKLISDKWLDKSFRSTLEKAQGESLSGEEAAIVRNLVHAAKFYHRVPQKTIVEFSKVTSNAFMAWSEAREKNNFKLFEPHLKRIVELNIEIAGYMGSAHNPYDALLDIYEPGLTAKKCKALFGALVNETESLLKDIKKTKVYATQNNQPGGEFPVDKQKALSDFVLSKIGYDFAAGRMDVSAHPFTSELGAGDIRITNRYSKHNFIESIMVAMHEGGHALYEQGINQKYDSTPLEGGASLGIHESQSRFWENQVGRSREFIEYLEPVLTAFYPKELYSTGTPELYLAFNKVSPSLIRVEADEVTYNLHIALRFELEEALVSKKISVDELPSVWRTKMKEYLGAVPESDADGVLQDVHWSYGSFGYFPTYTLGNLYAAQLTHFMKRELPAMEADIRAGEFVKILAWQRGKIHSFGSLYWPDELIKRITKEPLNAKYFIDYINNKYREIYN